MMPMEGFDSNVYGCSSCVMGCLESRLVVYLVSLFSLVIVGVDVWLTVQKMLSPFRFSQIDNINAIFLIRR